MKEGKSNLIYPELSYKIVGILYEVYNRLGYGLKEKVYHSAIEEELKIAGLDFYSELPYVIKYKNKIIARRYLDLLIEDKIIVELKNKDHFSRQNFKQVFEYIKITNKKLAIMATFTPGGVKCKRIINKTIS